MRGSSEPGHGDRYLEGAGHADDLNFVDAGALQFGLGCPEHRIHIAPVVLRGHDGEPPSNCSNVFPLNAAVELVRVLASQGAGVPGGTVAMLIPC